jgi:hypothetical protein
MALQPDVALQPAVHIYIYIYTSILLWPNYPHEQATIVVEEESPQEVDNAEEENDWDDAEDEVALGGEEGEEEEAQEDESPTCSCKLCMALCTDEVESADGKALFLLLYYHVDRIL